MKSFLRYLTAATLSALFAVAISAQTTPAGPCDDVAGIAALDAKIRELLQKTDEASLRQLVEAGKQYGEKYGSCKEEQAVLVAYLSKEMPGIEKRYTEVALRAKVKPFLDKFISGLKAKNWDDVYAGGKGLLELDPDTYRPAVLVLGSIGLDETAKNPRVTKWNDQTIQFAKQAIADLEAGKKFEIIVKGVAKPQYGYRDDKAGYNFSYKNRGDALGWMNYTIGYILVYDKKKMNEATPFLYKATQANSDTKNNPIAYIALSDAVLADPVIPEVEKLREELKADDAKKADDPTKFTPEVRQQKIDAFKAKNAMANAVVERALEYQARAYTVAKEQKKPAAEVAKILERAKVIYNVRFGETAGADAWIASKASQPIPNPSTEIKPVVEATPTSPTGSTSPAAAGTKPAAPIAKPVSNSPATKPASGTRPGRTR